MTPAARRVHAQVDLATCPPVTGLSQKGPGAPADLLDGASRHFRTIGPVAGYECRHGAGLQTAAILPPTAGPCSVR
jgi:hypothetical protein